MLVIYSEKTRSKSGSIDNQFAEPNLLITPIKKSVTKYLTLKKQQKYSMVAYHQQINWFMMQEVKVFSYLYLSKRFLGKGANLKCMALDREDSGVSGK